MKAANDNRPAEFDAKVMAYLPGLRRLAGRYRRDREERADLVTDTIAHCLENWHKLREDGGMWLWMAWAMRGVASASRNKRTVEIVDDPTGFLMESASVAPNQQNYAEVSLMLENSSSPAAKMALRNAMGFKLRELADERGVTRQRIDQMVKQGRRELAGVA